MRTKLLTFFIYTALFSFCFAQERGTFLQAPSEWRYEKLEFPLSFAPSLPLKGYEEVYFAPDWNKEESENFWTYAFAWILEEPIEFQKSTFENYLTTYYDGLMKVAGAVEEIATEVTLAATDNGYQGEVKTLDGFFTKKRLLLYLSIEASSNPNYWLFKLSPKERKHSNWTELNKVQIRP